MQISAIAHVIQLSVAPVFLLSGIGAILAVMTSRLSRIIDRARVLEARLEEASPDQTAALKSIGLARAVKNTHDAARRPPRSGRHDSRRQQPGRRSAGGRPARATRPVWPRSRLRRSSDAIQKTSKWFWSDPARHRAGRLELDAARREVVRLALLEMGIADTDACGMELATRTAIGGTSGLTPLPDAIETVRWLRDSGFRLALLTNGAGPAQRRKIARFRLADLFDAILVEGEVGFGKPDERVYRLALDELGVRPADAWMVGDNLEWDVAAPQDLGISGVWIDLRGNGLPEDARVRPEHIVRSLAELRSLIRTTR